MPDTSSALIAGASDNLIENNVMWNGNKNIVMRATGGGNVVAYNYMDDAYGSYYPNAPEAGLNAGHYTTPHMELLEGNYSHNYKGDSFWGNSIYITVFRNHLSGVRAARPPLDKYKHGPYPYMDLQGRTAVDIQAHSDDTNLVGNVLGFHGQSLLSYKSSALERRRLSQPLCFATRAVTRTRKPHGRTKRSRNFQRMVK